MIEILEWAGKNWLLATILSLVVGGCFITLCGTTQCMVRYFCAIFTRTCFCGTASKKPSGRVQPPRVTKIAGSSQDPEA